MKATKPRGDQSGLPLKKPRCRFSLHTIPHVSQTLGKLDESQLPICNSVESERPPTHAFVSTTVGHLPRTKTNHATVVLFLVDKQVLRGAKNFVDSLVAVFADIGNTFKGSKNFADHIFYKLRLVDCKAHVKSENFAVTVRDDFRILKTIFGSYTIHSVKSFRQAFASVGVI